MISNHFFVDDVELSYTACIYPASVAGWYSIGSGPAPRCRLGSSSGRYLFLSKNDIKNIRYTFWQSVLSLVHPTFSGLAPPLGGSILSQELTWSKGRKEGLLFSLSTVVEVNSDQ